MSNRIDIYGGFEVPTPEGYTWITCYHPKVGAHYQWI